MDFEPGSCGWLRKWPRFQLCHKDLPFKWISAASFFGNYMVERMNSAPTISCKILNWLEISEGDSINPKFEFVIIKILQYAWEAILNRHPSNWKFIPSPQGGSNQHVCLRPLPPSLSSWPVKVNVHSFGLPQWKFSLWIFTSCVDTGSQPGRQAGLRLGSSTRFER